MDEREFWALVAEYLAGLQTSGNQANPGGDMPYDDYNLQDTIGGLGAVDPYASDPVNMDGEASIGGWSNHPSLYDTSPSTVGHYVPQAALANQQRRADLFAQMQQGADNGVGGPLQGLFGDAPQITRSSPRPTAPTPVAAPVAGPVSAPPVATPTPYDFSFLNEDRGRRVAPRLVQALTQQAPRQFSAPAQRFPAYRAPAPIQRAPVYQAPTPARRIVTPPAPAPATARNVRRGF